MPNVRLAAYLPASVAEFAGAWADDAETSERHGAVRTRPLSADEVQFLQRLGYERVACMSDTDVAHLGIDALTFQRLAMLITESQFTRLVIGLAKAADVTVHHSCKSATCKGGPGIPGPSARGPAVHDVRGAEAGVAS